MLEAIKRNPVRVYALVAAVLTLLIQFGVTVTPAQYDSILHVVNALLGIGAVELIRSKVTPWSKDDDKGGPGIEDDLTGARIGIKPKIVVPGSASADPNSGDRPTPTDGTAAMVGWACLIGLVTTGCSLFTSQNARTLNDVAREACNLFFAGEPDVKAQAEAEGASPMEIAEKICRARGVLDPFLAAQQQAGTAARDNAEAAGAIKP